MCVDRLWYCGESKRAVVYAKKKNSGCALRFDFLGLASHEN